MIEMKTKTLEDYKNLGNGHIFTPKSVWKKLKCRGKDGVCRIIGIERRSEEDVTKASCPLSIPWSLNSPAEPFAKFRERSLLKRTGGMEEFSDSGALKSCPPPREIVFPIRK